MIRDSVDVAGKIRPWTLEDVVVPERLREKVEVSGQKARSIHEAVFGSRGEDGAMLVLLNMPR